VVVEDNQEHPYRNSVIRIGERDASIHFFHNGLNSLADPIKRVRPPGDPPGGPVVVTVVDSAGKPVERQLVTVDRPARPLTDLDWPGDFRSDSAGVVNIPPMEAGKHTIHVGPATVDAVVPPLPCDAAQVRCIMKKF